MSFIVTVTYYFYSLSPETRIKASVNGSNFILFFIIALFISAGIIKKLNVYETFINGAKEGFDIAIKIIPYLVAMLTAIAVFKASGLLSAFTNGIDFILQKLNWNTDFVPALPTALMKPLSGSGAREMMIETLQTYGAADEQACRCRTKGHHDHYPQPSVERTDTGCIRIDGKEDPQG